MAKRKPIPPKDRAALIEGARLTATNALRLAGDARLLFDHGRPASALALGTTALEECGKFWLLVSQAGMLVGNETLEWAKIDGAFRSHDLKGLFAYFSELGLPPEVRLIGPLFVGSEERRQAALYVNVEPDGWGSPALTTRQDAERIVKAASFLSRMVDQLIRFDQFEDLLETGAGKFRGKSPGEVADLFNAMQVERHNPTSGR